MARLITCPDCGHTKQSEDESETCPQCEGTMTAPAKKKYRAKPTSLEEESAKKKAKAPKAAEPRPKKAAALSLDDEDVSLDFPRDGSAAERLELDPGFNDETLLRQVAAELARDEVLHWAGRPSMEVAKKQGTVLRLVGLGLALLAAVLTAVVFAVSAIPKFVVVAPIVILLFGIAFLALGPRALTRQAERGWYAVTDRRAITFMANLWGESGHAKSYEPTALQKMWIKKSFWVKGAGDLVFHTDVHDNRTKWVERGTGRTVRETGHRVEHHYGFLGIADVKAVEALVHEVLLGGAGAAEEDE